MLMVVEAAPSIFLPDGVIVILFAAADPTLSLILYVVPVTGAAKGVIVRAEEVSTSIT